MNTEDRSQVHQVLLSRQHAIADSWYKAIARTSHVPHNAAEVREHLVELTEQAIAVLLAEPFDHGGAEAIGASLARLHYVEPEALGQTQEVLAQQLVEGLPGEPVVELQSRLAALLGRLAGGFLQQAREAILSEQERIRGALIRELQQREEESIRLSSAVKTSVDGIVIMDLEGKITYVNEAALKMYGTDDKEEVIGQDVLDLVTPEHREKGLAGIAFVLEKGYDKSRGYEVITKDGSRIPVELSAAIMKDVDGKPIGIVIIARDITERKRAEEALRKAHDELETRVEERTAELAKANVALQAEIAERRQVEEALRQSEEKYRTLVERSLQGLVVVQDFRVVFANTAFAEISGYTVEELLSLSPEKVKAIAHPEDQARVWRSFQDRLAGEPVPPRYDYRAIRKDGTVRWLEMFASRIQYGGKPAIQGAIVDITERRRVEEALLRAHQELETRVQERTAELAKTNEALQIEISERKQAEEEVKERNRELAALNAIATVVSQSLDLDEILNAALDKVLESMHLDIGGIYLADPVRRKLDLMVHRGISKEFAHEAKSVSVNEKTLEAVTAEGKLGRFILSAKAVIRDRVELKRIVSAMRKEGLSLASGVPVLLQAKEEILGLIVVASRESRQFARTELQLLTAIGQQVATAIQNARLYILAQRELAERRRTEKALRESEARYRSLFERVPVGLYRTTPAGQIVDANPAMVQMLGYPDRESLLAVNVADAYVAPEDRTRWRALIEREGVVKDFEVRFRKRDGTVVWVQDDTRVIRDADGRVLYYEGSLEDITERKRAEEARQRYAARLKQRAEELASLNQTSRVVTSLLDVQEVLASILTLAGQVLNSVYTSVVLVREDGTLDVSAENFEGLPPIEVRTRPRGITRRIMATGEPLVFDEVVDDGTHNPSIVAVGVKSYAGMPLIARGQTLGVLFVRSTEPRAFSDQVPLLTAFANQVAIAIVNAQLYEQVRAGRERLQTLSHRLVEVQETERQRIARELHDEIGQALTGLKLALDISMDLPTDAARARLGEAQALVNELMLQVRELSLDLRPSMLDNLGLLPTLLWHFERYTAQTNVEVAFEHTELEGRFAPEVETAAYRIVQEALTNVARHAGVNAVTVRLWAKQDILGVQIEDQGIGFDPEAALTTGATSGLAGMRERAVLLRGKLTVESAPGTGTRLTAELPLSDHPLERREMER